MNQVMALRMPPAPLLRLRHFTDSSSGELPDTTADTGSSSGVELTSLSPSITSANIGPFTEFSFTSSKPSLTLPTALSSSPSPLSVPLLPTPSVKNSGLSSSGVRLHAICIGEGIDASSLGVLAAMVIPSVVGLVILLSFATFRPRFRQVYALREWFVQQDLRPRPLSSSFLGFLFPPVPLVPTLPSDVSSSGRSAATNAALFPSDEQLSQRVLWTGVLVILLWSIVGLAAALPLFSVSIPCLANLTSPSVSEGAFSTLQDLSLMRLMRTIDNGSLDSLTTLRNRALSENVGPNSVHTRIIILTVLAIALGVLPALWIVLKELNLFISHRKNFIDVLCEGKELGWLSIKKAPGFVGWGEKQLKDFILKQGLSISLELSEIRSSRRTERRRRRTGDHQPLHSPEAANLEVDIQSLFSIGDTQALALLIEERDEILDNLEIAETKYISSFRVTTPDPSVIDFEPLPPVNTDRPYISRPLPLGQVQTQGFRSRRRRGNPAFAASSLAPTSFVAPSQYYKLRSVQGVNDGHLGFEQRESFADSISSRLIGSSSRFLELALSSPRYGRIPLGNLHLAETEGEPSSLSKNESWNYSSIPDPMRFGPNYTIPELVESSGDGTRTLDGEEWVDLNYAVGGDSEPNGPLSGSLNSRMRSKKEALAMSQRESFPMRRNRDIDDSNIVAPPHLRLQPSQPFVRPLDGIDFGDLGQVYADITQWRTRLKIINAEIAEVQRDCYNDIADGARIKGWLMVGRGLCYIPGIQLIEGRAKEDIRWDVLQNERSPFDTAVLWAIILVVITLLVIGLTAAAGLALSNAPDFANSVTFLQPLLRSNPFSAGLATVAVPAVATVVFTSLSVILLSWASNVHGCISVSNCQIFNFKVTFYVMTLVAAIWLVTVGALLFALPAFKNDTNIARSIASGSIYIGILALSIVVILAIVFPAILLFQPSRLWRVLREERQAITPRQRFRAIYPSSYNPSYATAFCILALTFAALFTLIFPLIGPAALLLLFFTLIAHRFLVGYVYGRMHSQTGGLLQIWLIKRLGTLVSLQPMLLGLIFLSRGFRIEAVVLLGTGVAVVVFTEAYTSWKLCRPKRRSLSSATQNALDAFEVAAWDKCCRSVDDEGRANGGSSVRSAHMERSGSMASVLDMMSLTLAVFPSNPGYRGPVPLRTETLDDLTATERAARTHPDAPPHLPPLPFAGHAEDMAGILYAPELIAPPPIIWLPNDSSGVARSEAVDLQRYHDLSVTLDMRAPDDAMPRRSSSSCTRRP